MCRCVNDTGSQFYDGMLGFLDCQKMESKDRCDYWMHLCPDITNKILEFACVSLGQAKVMRRVSKQFNDFVLDNFDWTRFVDLKSLSPRYHISFCKVDSQKQKFAENVERIISNNPLVCAAMTTDGNVMEWVLQQRLYYYSNIQTVSLQYSKHHVSCGSDGCTVQMLFPELTDKLNLSITVGVHHHSWNFVRDSLDKFAFGVDCNKCKGSSYRDHNFVQFNWKGLTPEAFMAFMKPTPKQWGFTCNYDTVQTRFGDLVNHSLGLERVRGIIEFLQKSRFSYKAHEWHIRSIPDDRWNDIFDVEFMQRYLLWASRQKDGHVLSRLCDKQRSVIGRQDISGYLDFVGQFDNSKLRCRMIDSCRLTWYQIIKGHPDLIWFFVETFYQTDFNSYISFLELVPSQTIADFVGQEHLQTALEYWFDRPQDDGRNHRRLVSLIRDKSSNIQQKRDRESVDDRFTSIKMRYHAPCTQHQDHHKRLKLESTNISDQPNNSGSGESPQKRLKEENN